LALSGYPPKDLLERDGFLDAAAASLDALAAALAGSPTAVLIGFPERLPSVPSGRAVANAAALIEGGRVTHVTRKSLLPTYDVFDEWRYFEPAASVAPVPFRGRKLGVSICEDIWNDADFWPQRRYRADPIEALVAAGAELIVNVSASPYTMEKRHLRPRMLAATARRWGRPLVFVNQVGGQDDLVFDGASLALDAGGAVIARGAENAADLVLCDVDAGTGTVAPFDASDERSALAALELGTRDYARRCGFSQALLGLSGGIDSALVACVAARALGPRNLLGVAMPSRFSSPGSLADAEALARNLGIDFTVIPIEPMLAAYLDGLAPALEEFAPRQPPAASAAAADLTRQNLQARIRGAILMALSNRQGRLLLTTGNKSELATGYCTLYGDMAGGLAVDQAPLGGAPRRPDGPGRAAALRSPRPDPRGPPGRRPRRPGAGRARLRAGGRRRCRAPGADQRVQAAADAPGPQDHRQGVRPGAPIPDRARRRLTWSPQRVPHLPRWAPTAEPFRPTRLSAGADRLAVAGARLYGPAARHGGLGRCALPLQFCLVTGSARRSFGRPCGCWRRWRKNGATPSRSARR